jgi:GNAT superfamily N-acetyltransferase
MLNNLSIREMQKADLAFAAECTAAEGWVSEDLSTLEGFFLHDRHGCLVAELNKQRVGICVATSYDKSGFIGELIVLPEARGRGVGASLLNHAVQILCKRGAEAIYLDGVLKAVGLYERNGFRKVTRSWRFSGYLPGELDQTVRRMLPGDLPYVSALDRAYFSADRRFFLERRFQLYPELSYVMLSGDEIIGYILGRQGRGWLSAGPWVVREGANHLVALLHALALQSESRPISLGILDINQAAIHLAHSLGFTERPDSPWRMVWGKGGGLGASPGCYAIGSAAKG